MEVWVKDRITVKFNLVVNMFVSTLSVFSWFVLCSTEIIDSSLDCYQKGRQFVNQSESLSL